MFVFVVISGVLLIRTILKQIEIVEMAGREKSSFVTMSSHDLRSPVTAVKGYASMLLENSFGPIPERAREAANRIFLSAEHMIHLIDDFLNLSRIERGAMEYFFKKTDLKAIVEIVFDGFKMLNEKDKKRTCANSQHTAGRNF